LTALVLPRREVVRSWALLALVAFATAVPATVTGIAAARGRFNGDGKPYIQDGIFVPDTPQNERIRRHQQLGVGGAIIAVVQAVLALACLRGREPNRCVAAVLAVLLAVAWGVGGHMGGQELWGPDTFPAFH
jgi:hypothetical protein